ncbi:MAG: hypothetical protein IJK53_10415 [Erysipelotrichaceae bacterium]|nr:hypothetical protein [Clostridia bacterium]MBQ6217783.1 hypothetical protein [Erysipelotrichaceae bacterium]
MRILRICILFIFIATSIAFGIDQFFSYRDKDVIAPIINCSEDVLHLSVKADDKEFLKGMTAEDNKDGDVTSTLLIAGKSNFIEEGVIRVDYVAFDSHNNVGTYNRRVIYDDYHSPRFSSKSPLMTRSETSVDFSFFEATDVLEGDISNKIKVTYGVGVSDTSNEYPFTMEVTNGYGDIEKLDLALDIVSNREYSRQCPALSDYIIYVPVGGEVDLSSYLIGIRQGDHVIDFEESDYYKENVIIDDYTDYERPGVYTAEFSLRIAYSTYTVTKMVVIVTEDF